MKIVVIAMQCNFNEGDKLDAHRPLPITREGGHKIGENGATSFMDGP